jgi:hypothetical protein
MSQFQKLKFLELFLSYGENRLSVIPYNTTNQRFSPAAFGRHFRKPNKVSGGAHKRLSQILIF